MYFKKKVDDELSFFITINVARSKRTKTYPRVRGKFTLQKQNTIEYARYLDLRTRLRNINTEYPLRDREMDEYFDLKTKYEYNLDVFYFVFDIKRDSHSRIECLATSTAGSKEIDGLHWQNEIYKGMMKDKQHLRTLREPELRRLFDKESFWQDILSEYVFAILKL